ncbi:MAG: WD40/YVTN/BNR-like repeat-containing protein, partial [Gammaproteobacteria bacterium]
AGQISRIVVNPTNPDIVYVAVLGNVWKPGKDRGVFMTTDGGKTWTKTLYVNDTTGASDIAMDPQNPNVMFAGMWTVQRKPWTLVNGSSDGGIWRSVDGGRTWTKLSAGLPSGPTNRVALAIAPSNPNKIYALMSTADQVLWGSDDMGDHWHAISNNHALNVRPFYFSTIAVAPNDADKVYFGSFQMLMSTDGGKTAHVIDDDVHVDHHDIWIDPKDPNRIIQGNDGGAYESLNGGKSWRYFDNLPIEQMYTVSIGNTQPFEICGGLQDNNAACGPSNSLEYSGIWGADWWNPAGGDGVYAVPAPSDPSIVYANSQNGFAFRIDTKTMTAKFLKPYLPGASNMPVSKLKYRFNWAAPITVSPTDANTVYTGGNVVFKSTDGGTNWQPISGDLTRNDKKHQPIAGGPVNHDISGAENFDTILSLVIAPTDSKVMWVGTDDGLVWVTKDNGGHWTKVSPSLPKSAQLGRIYQIGVSPFDTGTAYITVDAHMMGDAHPYVFKTSNYGGSWKRMDRGLPDTAPAFVVREDPNQRGLLALGTQQGLYLSGDDGSHWTRVTANLPTMPVWDLKFTKNPHDLVLATHGRGFWVFDNIEPIEQWSAAIAKDDFHLFSASQGIEWVKYFGRHIGPAPTDFVAPNPPSGPVISYYLKSAAGKGDSAKSGKPAVTITITDNAGNAVATFHGPGKAGINSIAWNMRYDGAKLPKFLKTQSFFGGGGGPTGPTALPGDYRATVSVDGHSANEQLQVAADPRLATPLDTQQRALNTGLELRNDVNAAVAMLERTHTTLDILGNVIGDTADATKGSDRAAAHDAAAGLKRQLGGFALQMFDPQVQLGVPEDDIRYITRFGMRLYGLYRMVGQMGPTQAPNAEQQGVIAGLQGQLRQYLATFNGDLRQAVLNYNQLAYKAGVQTLPAGKPIIIEPVATGMKAAPTPSSAMRGGSSDGLK